MKPKLPTDLPKRDGALGGQDALAHVRQDASGRWIEHPLTDHLLGVAELTGQFSRSFHNQDWGYLAGLLHDLGKFSPEFQRYIKTASGYDPDAHLEGAPGKVDHSTAGAIHAVEGYGAAGRILAYLIAGHHAGLPDWTHGVGVGGVLSERGGFAEYFFGGYWAQDNSPYRDASFSGGGQ